MKVIFLDKDGVISKEKHFLHKVEDVELIEGSAEAIKLLNENGFKVVVITNQPVVAIGLCTEDELDAIHNRLIKLLGEKGAKIDKLYYCPHHPIKGKDPNYTRECMCRKPKPGMIIQAQKDLNIPNLTDCFIVGDKIGDIKTGDLAGIKNTILVSTGYGGNEHWKDAEPMYCAENLYKAIKNIILGEGQ